MRARLVIEEEIGKPVIYNKKQIIDLMLAGEEPEVQEIMRTEYETADPEEFKELAASIGFHPIGKFWTAHDVVDPYDTTNENLNEGKSQIEGDYTEAVWKMDKFMPDDFELQAEYYEILDDETMDEEEKVQKLIEFFDSYADEDIMDRYFPEGGTIEGFARYIVDEEAV